MSWEGAERTATYWGRERGLAVGMARRGFSVTMRSAARCDRARRAGLCSWPGARSCPPARPREHEGASTMAAQPISADQIPPGKEVATLAGGCFWCLEAVYDDLAGVESVESGYMVGHTKNPSYEAVCAGETGHAEATRITFDPKIVSFRELLDIFFVIHDPTTLNRQGNDVGTQYRSAIFYHSPEQKRIA